MYGITAKIGYIIGDNHGSNDTLCRARNTHLLEEYIDWDPVHHRLRCIGHVLNLAVQVFLFGDAEIDETNEEEGEEMAATKPRGKKSGGKAS
jgi:hypothetical protein